MTAPFSAPRAPASARFDLGTGSSVEQPLELPAPWTPPARPGIPLLASVVPVLGAVALWAVTGSILSLWLAALGPLIAVATLADGARTARRDRRRTERAAELARARVLRAIGERHEVERDRRWSRHPDAAGFLGRDGEIWRAVPDRADALVVGSGERPSSLRVSGGGEDPASIEVRRRAAILSHAPAVVSPSSGVAVVADDVLGAAVLRALTLQLCMALPPGEIAITGPLRGDNSWAEALPQRRSPGVRTLTLLAPDEPAPAEVDIALVRVRPGTPPPPRCQVVLTVDSPTRAILDVAGDVQEIAVEAVGLAQAATIAAELAERAVRSFGSPDADGPLPLSSVLDAAPAPARDRLPAVLGTEAGEPRIVDLVVDGPHAIVAGVTGSGKSELLVTWILSLCARHSTREVSFLLADFKGGTAFDALAALPHVTGVLTDLEGSGARRAIESLRAEVRWREAELARCGARDILDPRLELPRLVIVVDEFAALLGDHPELHAVFADVAARGRALGMHLVLGTQRPSGVMRESLLANCPLRISLRVGDAADSRAVMGTTQAAELPGGPGGRGLALIRTASDAAPRRVRIALSDPTDIATISAASTGPQPRRPWLPELPVDLEWEELARVHPAVPGPDGGRSLLLGLIDEPENQRQRAAEVHLTDRGLLVIGGAGSGKTTALRTIAAQAPGPLIAVPADGEGAWDALTALVEEPPARGTLVIVDDLDALAARLPHDYAAELTDGLERLFRSAGDAGILVVAAAQRLSGSAARLGDLLPRRLVLATASRAEYVAAGGDPAHYAPSERPGRGRLDGRATQVARSAFRGGTPSAPEQTWRPVHSLTGFVARRSPVARTALADWESHGARIVSLDEYAGDTGWLAEDRIVVMGDPDEWQRHWRALSSVRAESDLVVDVACGAELRALTGTRSLPPYCEQGRGRAWLLTAGGTPRRVVLPAAAATAAGA